MQNLCGEVLTYLQNFHSSKKSGVCIIWGGNTLGWFVWPFLSYLLLLCDTPGYILLSATHATVAVKCTAISVFCFTYVIHRCSSPAVCYRRCHNFFCVDALNLLHWDWCTYADAQIANPNYSVTFWEHFLLTPLPRTNTDPEIGLSNLFLRWKPGGRELFFDLMNVSTPNNKVPFFLCLSSALEMLHGGIIRQAVKLFYNKPGGTVQKSTVYLG